MLDAAGHDLVLIETVGVGQDEIDIVRLADVTVVILVPGMGDDVQTIKAGIMEIADIFVINKSDREGADRVEREIRSMQSLAIRADSWTPPIVKTVASEGRGFAELAAAIVNYEQFLKQKDLAVKEEDSQAGATPDRNAARRPAGTLAKRTPAGRRDRAPTPPKSPSTSAIRIRWWRRLLAGSKTKPTTETRRHGEKKRFRMSNISVRGNCLLRKAESPRANTKS